MITFPTIISCARRSLKRRRHWPQDVGHKSQPLDPGLQVRTLDLPLVNGRELVPRSHSYLQPSR